jgi:hypothetical protein
MGRELAKVLVISHDRGSVIGDDGRAVVDEQFLDIREHRFFVLLAPPARSNHPLPSASTGFHSRRVRLVASASIS